MDSPSAESSCLFPPLSNQHLLPRPQSCSRFSAPSVTSGVTQIERLICTTASRRRAPPALLCYGRLWAASKPRSAGAARDAGAGRPGWRGWQGRSRSARVLWDVGDIGGGRDEEGRRGGSDEEGRRGGSSAGHLSIGRGWPPRRVEARHRPPLAAACAGSLGAPPPPTYSGLWICGKSKEGEGGPHAVGGGWRVRPAREK
ncbi:hypothetical protein PVAP13_2NG344803 [Panicum virgatum]|uniref:Uncharacterized protein n=1 Tax=Panicum virgatum TaxID=38727 RepID=A0A8T0VKU4_PANVG|nr:hypothetical protein PVAP13_2NG344803 [Panicum virgatum]